MRTIKDRFRNHKFNKTTSHTSRNTSTSRTTSKNPSYLFLLCRCKLLDSLQIRLIPEESQPRKELKKFADVADASMHNVTISGLVPFTSYLIYVSAFTIIGNGPEADAVSLQTPEGGEVFKWRTVNLFFVTVMRNLNHVIIFSCQQTGHTF